MSQELDWTALRGHFRVRLRARMAEVRALVDRIAAEDHEQPGLDALALQFHSLAGIGGTYGYPAITELARRGEEACRTRPLPLHAIDEITRAITHIGEEEDAFPRS